MITLEQLKAMVNTIMTNPTEAPLVSVQLLDELAGLYSVTEMNQQQIEELKATNQSLTNTNMQLFLKMTGGNGAKPEDAQEERAEDTQTPLNSLDETIDMIRNDGKEVEHGTN